jgi:hypothetical protein
MFFFVVIVRLRDIGGSANHHSLRRVWATEREFVAPII